MSLNDLQTLFGQHPSSALVQIHLSSLAGSSSSTNISLPLSPEVKSYPDAIYFNYFSIGLSLLFKPINGYKPKTGLLRDDLQDDKLVLGGLDIYNVRSPKEGQRKTKQPYSTYPADTIMLALASVPDKPDRAKEIVVKVSTTGKEFVEIMGEPERKGGGAGPSSGSIGIWCEWTKDGVLVEFGGEEARGPQAWERGKDAVWNIITLFPPGQSV
ncbi:hypothetical protein BDY19DRAFT_988582 [Irpex rosettiformis]|uniref:Uncharacterized protein n=1 Tax=Irpex rosettiformis TaxID=378272 RepID=A0ACB8UM99_9APHY|nr:hypothetical protein BDY19DRAFT_988582 [Irpex rosettiformis]